MATAQGKKKKKKQWQKYNQNIIKTWEMED